MKSIIKCLGATAAIAAVLFAIPASATSVLIGSSNGTVGELDVTTGAISHSFNVGASLFDIAIDRNGNVFAFVGGLALLSIDTTLQTSAAVGNLGFFMNAAAFDASNTLYGAGNGTLYTVNTATGAGTVVGNIGASYDSSGDLAFGLGGVLYGTSTTGCVLGNCLFSIDPTTGTGSLVGGIGFDNVFGLAFLDGILYGSTEGGQLLSLNTSTGAGTLLRTYGFPGLDLGAAAPTPVPLPAALPLFVGGLGLFGLLGWHRKRMAAAAA